MLLETQLRNGEITSGQANIGGSMLTSTHVTVRTMEIQKLLASSSAY